jgi:serine/threonine-protein kinase
MTAEAKKLPELSEMLEGDFAEPLPTPFDSRLVSEAGRYASGNVIAGKYQLANVLGEGGMGSVWVAKNRTLDLDVALKLMRSELAEEIEGVAERMLQEARAAASIGHPAIIQVFDFGYTELGDPFIVMELLHGESLLQAIRRRGRLSAPRAVQTLLPIIDALSSAHARGIVHRDVKPENIFLSRPAGHRLQPKVLDFGIAKLEQRAAERLTRDGAVIGSPAYMAPEQLRGEHDVDARADIWAVSVVLYQMLSGQRPFEGDSYHASMWNVLNAEPFPLAERAIDEPELWKILERCLEKDKARRYPDMRALGRELAQWLLARGINEDIGEASLRAWFADDELEADAARSFFPSYLPLQQPAPWHGVETIPTLARDVRESSGTRPVAAPALPELRRAAAGTKLASPGSGRGWVVVTLVTLVCAVLSFAGAALVSTRSSPENVEAASTLPVQAPRPRPASEHRFDRARPPLAPIPRTGPNAPLLYVDDPPPRRAAARSVEFESTKDMRAHDDRPKRALPRRTAP